jgi:hypothetical protein
MAASTELVIPHQSSTSTAQLTPVSRVKVEQGEELLTILNDDSDGNSPVVAPPIRSLVINSSVPNSVEGNPTPISHPCPTLVITSPSML